MCGIAGLVGERWSDADLDRLFAGVRHRGPDGAGTRKIGPVRLGMTRLRFRGDEIEMPVAVGATIAAFNGQVFGLRDGAGTWIAIPEGVDHEIAAVMGPAGAGVTLGGTADRVDGMYACAMVSNEGETLRLTTDPWFIKPLFYRRDARGLAFCSEPGPLQQLGGPGRIDRRALAELFRYGWPLDDRCVVEGLHAAWSHDLTIEGSTLVSTPKRESPPAAVDGDPATTLRRAVARSVRRCLTGSGPFGLALSGGLDSSILAWELNAAGVEGLVTLSVRMDDDGVADLAELGLPAGGAWETWRHQVVAIENHEDLLRRFEASTRAFGQPSTMSSLPLYHCLAEAAAKEGVRVLLTGEGVDELFCGYSSYAKVAELADPLDYYRHPQRERLVRRLMGDGAIRQAEDRFRSVYGDVSDIRPVERQLRLTRLLLRSDLCLMARSIEGRVPFLHNGIPELALSLPWDTLVAGGGKRALRQAYADVLGPRGRQAKTRFKASDLMLRQCLGDLSVQARLARALEPVFGRETLSDSLAILSLDDGFDADILCLLLSLTFMIEDGSIDANAA